ncbi:MAG: signal peptidase I [Firmicutes bacterium]|nr:signal peptidase I [Candidatus Colimorpha enterica]
MDKPKQTLFEKILNIFTSVLVGLVVLAALFLMGARIVGLQVYTVISGSMEPTYYPGDLIYVKRAQAEEIKVGDPVTFVLNEDLIVATHRVTKIDYENQRFYTKGDNNMIEDIDPVHFKNLIGKPIFRIPYLGYTSKWVQSPPGLYIAIAAGIALLGLVFIPDLFREAKEDELKKKEEELRKLEEELKKREEEISK